MVLIGSEAKRGGSWLSVWQPTFDFGQIFPILLRMIIGIMEKKIIKKFDLEEEI